MFHAKTRTECMQVTSVLGSPGQCCTRDLECTSATEPCRNHCGSQCIPCPQAGAGKMSVLHPLSSFIQVPPNSFLSDLGVTYPARASIGFTLSCIITQTTEELVHSPALQKPPLPCLPVPLRRRTLVSMPCLLFYVRFAAEWEKNLRYLGP